MSERRKYEGTNGNKNYQVVESPVVGEQVAELLSHLVQELKEFEDPAQVPAEQAEQVPFDDPA